MAAVDAAEARCRSGDVSVAKECFVAGSAYDRGSAGRPLRADVAVELFMIGCSADAEDPSCGALRNEVVSLALAPSTRPRARAVLETMCERHREALCNDLAGAYGDGSLGPKSLANAFALYDRTCHLDLESVGAASLDAMAEACGDVAEILRSGAVVLPTGEAERRAVEAEARSKAALARLSQKTSHGRP
jgi:hypothetical protein